MALKAGLHGENLQLAHIPGNDGWPLIGNTLKFFINTYDVGAQFHDAYGEIYRNRAFFMRFLTFASPEGADFVLRDTEKNFSAKLGWAPFLGNTYPETLQMLDADVHRVHRQAMNVVFQPAAIAGYSLLLNRAVEEKSNWPTNRIVRMYDELKALTLAMNAEALMGLDIERDVAYIMERFITLDKGIAALVPYPVPGLGLWRALRARNEILEHFRPQIAARRERVGNDLFTRLCHAVDENGALLPDDAVLNHLLGILRASAETTTGALSIAMYYLARHLEWQERLRARSFEVGAGPLQPEGLTKLDEHELVFLEAMRIVPVAPMLFRRCVKDCEFKGNRIPAGAQVAVDVGYILRSPLYWTDPMRFDPMRFAEPRMEHKRRRSQWVNFGLGAHFCIGQFFALMVAKIVLHRLLTKYSFELVDPGELKLYTVPATVPKDGLRMRLTAIGRAAESAGGKAA
jgi:cytochrome P450